MADFLHRRLGKEALLVRRDPAAAQELFGWDRLNAALAEHRLTHPRLRLEQSAQDVTKGLFRERRSRRGGVLYDVHPATLNERLRDGATLILDSANELSPPLQRICARLAAEFACACQTNLYACWGVTQGFEVHWDDHDVFVVQVEGRKRWTLYGATREAPTRRDPSHEQAPPAEPLDELILEAGDVLYLPRGYWHAAVGLGGPTLHLTIGLTRRSGGDFLHWLADRALMDVAVRRDLPLERDDAVLGAHIAGLLARLAAESPDTLAKLFRRHVEATQAPRPRLSFPFIGGEETELAPDTEIALADGIARVVEAADAGEVILSWRGVEFTVDANLEAPLQALVAGRTLRYAELEAAVPEAMRPSLPAFVLDMLRRGAFVLAGEAAR